MPGTGQCWRCGVPLAAQFAYPQYAAKPRRGASCWMIAFLLLLFAVAGAGLGIYFLWRKVMPPDLQSQVVSPEQSKAEGMLKDLGSKAPDLGGSSTLPGIVVGMKQREVLERMGEPSLKEHGFLITDKNEMLPRETWQYREGYVMFRYDNVIESAPGRAPILSKVGQ